MASNPISFKRFQDDWRLLAISVVIFCIASLVYCFFAVPVYQASARFLVYPNDNLTSSRDVVSSLDTLDKRSISTTYADILGSDRVFQDTVNRLKLVPGQVSQINIHSEVQANANILVLYVEGPDPQVVALLANNIGQNGISYIESIYQVFDIAFLDKAVEPTTPIRPRPLIYTLIAIGIGLGVGLLLILLRDLLRVPVEILRERSITDRQSLAYTRKYMIRALNNEVVQNKGAPLAFGLLHLEGLEDLMEGLPGPILEALLQNVVKQLHSLLRGNDLVARWDKLDFSVMLSNTPEVPAQKTFERLLQALQKNIGMETGAAIFLSPSAGLVICKAGENTDLILRRAGEALEDAGSVASRLVVVK